MRSRPACGKLAAEQPCDVLITEIGGTTGDIEGLPFLEAIRQFVLEVGPQNVVIMHVTLVPYIKAAGELKTKPSQQSIAKLREIGLHPQVLICRTEHPLDEYVRRQASVFCNVPLDAVVEARDVQHSIYEMPLMLQKERLDETVCKLLGLTVAPAEMHGLEQIRRARDQTEKAGENRRGGQIHRPAGCLQIDLRIA